MNSSEAIQAQGGLAIPAGPLGGGEPAQVIPFRARDERLPRIACAPCRDCRVRARCAKSRADIGSHVGVTVETVSRTLSAFRKAGMLEVHKRHIVIRSLDGLRAIREREGA